MRTVSHRETMRETNPVTGSVCVESTLSDVQLSTVERPDVDPGASVAILALALGAQGQTRIHICFAIMSLRVTSLEGWPSLFVARAACPADASYEQSLSFYRGLQGLLPPLSVSRGWPVIGEVMRSP